MAIPTLGKLESVDIRSVWPTESSDFTPWLASKLDNLSKELGQSFALEQVEHPIGTFRLDILAKDEEGVPVIIENQFGYSDHKHLGQLITYASAPFSGETEARTVIWIAEKFCPEHLSALEWLNKNSSEEVSYFAVELEIFRIGDSLPAPHFKVVCRPNTWSKEVGRDNTPTGSLYKEFWISCKAFVSQHSTILAPRTAKAQTWLSAHTGVRDFKFAFTASIKDNSVGCEIAYHGPSPGEALSLLQQNKSEIETRYGAPLIWEICSAKCSKIRDARPNSNVSARDKWPEFQNWMMGRGEKLFAAVMPYLQSLHFPPATADES